LYAIAPDETGERRGFPLIIHTTQALKKMAAAGTLLALEVSCEMHARRRGPVAGRQDGQNTKWYCDDCIAAHGLRFSIPSSQNEACRLCPS
jgi:hypothetical protein